MVEQGLSRIAARSQRQAMDWSLVLASQAIETTIDHSEEPPAWGLIVAEKDYDRALESIRLYRLENRRWGWRYKVAGDVVFDWTAILWVFLVCAVFWVSEVNPALQANGLMNGLKVSQGQWWRLFTAIWLHTDVGHLGSNASLGLVLLGLTMARYGTGLGLLASYLAGVGGNLLVWALDPQRSSIGASGAVLGCLGLIGAHTFSFRLRTPQKRKMLLLGVLGGTFLFILFGLSPGTDIRAHLGGFLTGLLVGGVLSQIPQAAQSSRVNLAAAVGFLVLVVWPWWKAIFA